MLIKVNDSINIRWYAPLIGQVVDVHPTIIRGRYRLLNNEHNQEILKRNPCRYNMDFILRNDINYCYGVIPEDCERVRYSSNKTASILLAGDESYVL